MPHMLRYAHGSIFLYFLYFVFLPLLIIRVRLELSLAGRQFSPNIEWISSTIRYGQMQSLLMLNTTRTCFSVIYAHDLLSFDDGNVTYTPQNQTRILQRTPNPEINWTGFWFASFVFFFLLLFFVPHNSKRNVNDSFTRLLIRICLIGLKTDAYTRLTANRVWGIDLNSYFRIMWLSLRNSNSNNNRSVLNPFYGCCCLLLFCYLFCIIQIFMYTLALALSYIFKMNFVFLYNNIGIFFL